MLDNFRETPILSIQHCAVTDIPPDSKIPQPSFIQIENIKTNSLDLPKPSPQPVFTLEDFMNCVDKTEDDRRKKTNDQEQERKRDMMDFKRMLQLPP